MVDSKVFVRCYSNKGMAMESIHISINLFFPSEVDKSASYCAMHENRENGTFLLRIL